MLPPDQPARQLPYLHPGKLEYNALRHSRFLLQLPFISSSRQWQSHFENLVTAYLNIRLRKRKM
jgi:hypothetical protein